MFISKLNSKSVFKFPINVGKNWRWQNVLKETKSHFFLCLATADSISICVFPTKGLRFIIKKRNKLKAHKESLKQNKTAQSYRSALDLELKACENNMKIL